MVAGGHGPRPLGPQDLDGDFTLVPEIGGEIDGGKRTLTNLSLNPIAISEGGPKCFKLAVLAQHTVPGKWD